MLHLLQTAAAYVPLSLAQAALNGVLSTPPTEPRVDRFPAAVLFADVSGFTPLTEALGQKGSEGPEELTRLLNRYFSWMIAFVEAQGGEVVKFGGDALTVVFPAKEEPLSMATRRAMQAAKTMQSSMEEFGIIESSVGLVTLKMKISIGAGEILAAWVGGIDSRWEYFIAGDPLRQTAQADHSAKQGQIVLSPEAELIIEPHSLPPRPLDRLVWGDAQNIPEIEAILRCYIPKPVRTWLDQELHSWLATLRPMSVLFVNVKGIDYEDHDAIEQLHTFVRGVQESLNLYQGTLTRLTVDDKGTVLLILFGAPPYSHEDDPERALRCALDLQTLANEQKLQLAIGVTTGRVFAGPVGGDTRREYTVMGDTVNLAARLMVVAGPGRICCSYETYRSVYGKMKFEHLQPVEVKGKLGLIPIYRPIGVYHPTEQLEQLEQVELNEPLIGRQAELTKLTAAVNKIQAGDSRIMIIEGEAGIGKSKLIRASLQLMKERGLTTLLGMGRSIEQEVPYRAWQDIFYSYFSLQNIGADPDRPLKIRQRIETEIARLVPDLAQYIPLLNDLLNLGFSKNETTASFDKHLRQEKLNELLLALLRARVQENPLVLILEDSHWLDSRSWRLVVQVSVAAVQEQWPILLILVTRPPAGVTMRTETTMLAALEETEYLRLDSLTQDETLDLAAMRLGLTSNELPEAVAELVRRRAGGNPFFAEEIFYALHDNGFITFKTMQDKIRCLINDDLSRAAQTLPATIQNVILARIDQLSPEKQLTLKVAAVIGQTFTFETLSDILRKHLDVNEGLLKVYLNDLTHLGLIQPETPDSHHQTYLFKHTIIQDVTYQSLLFDRRRQLHRDVAAWFEQTYRVKTGKLKLFFEQDINQGFSVIPTTLPSISQLSPHYTLLVYHWHQAEEKERECYYASLVGQQAVAQFANAEAIGYLSQALALTPTTNTLRQYNLLLARETVYNRLGERGKQGQDLEVLATLVDQLETPQRKATVALRQANYALITNDYAKALNAVERAINQAYQVRNIVIESKGYIIRSKALLNQGQYKPACETVKKALTLARNNKNQVQEAESLQLIAEISRLQGNYDQAKVLFQQGLAICRSNGYRSIEAECLNTRGLIQYHQGSYAAAQESFELAISIFYTLGYRREELKSFHNIGLVHLCLGNFETARDYFELALDTGREIDDRETTATALSNLGLTYCKLGDYMAARSYLGQSLGIFREIGNRVDEANALNRFGFVYYNIGDNRTAKRYCELALSIHQEVGNQDGESSSLTYLGHALVALDQLKSAKDSYEQALNLRRKMNQPGPAVDILTGLTQAAAKQNKLDLAQTYLDEILTWIETNDLTCLDNPFWVYLRVYNILQAIPTASKQAGIILSRAYASLQEQALQLGHEKAKCNFLEKIHDHADIIALWNGNKKAPQRVDRSRKLSKVKQSFRMEREQIIQIVKAARAKGEIPNLFKANLKEMDLSGVDLRRAYLSGADLSGANLVGTDLSWAYLREANLDGVNLSKANLNGANLFRANLSQANLNESNLRRVNLRGANLYEATLYRTNLRGANLFRTNLCDANLVEATMIGANTSGADLSQANLTDANITREQLSLTSNLEHAIMPDGIKRSQNGNTA